MELNVEKLINWFNTNKRDLPWRHIIDSYPIWISEIMLQQTRVETVIPYYLRFLKTLPTVFDLAKVEDEKLFKLWEGLGYYSRARNLKESAKMIVEHFNGQFPNHYQDALSLKGIGDYTAGAILSRAYQLPYACVDGNVLRVLTRYLADDIDISLSSTKTYFKQELEKLSPSHWGDFNESLMELGATICTFKKATCEKCPLNDKCLAYQKEEVYHYPLKSKKIVNKLYDYTCLFFKYQNQFYFESIKEGVLKDLLSPILIDQKMDQTSVKKHLQELKINNYKLIDIGQQKHVFTHQTWLMQGFLIELQNNPLLKENFYSTEQIQNQISIPVCFQKFFEKLNIKEFTK